MLKQIKKTIVVLLLVFFAVSLTSSAVSANGNRDTGWRVNGWEGHDSGWFMNNGWHWYNTHWYDDNWWHDNYMRDDSDWYYHNNYHWWNGGWHDDNYKDWRDQKR